MINKYLKRFKLSAHNNKLIVLINLDLNFTCGWMAKN